MSKKKKFMKKKFKAEIVSQLKKANLPNQPQEIIKVAEPVTQVESKPDEPMAESQIEAIQTKKDLKKTVLIVGFLIIILLIVYFTNIKTGWLDNFADTLAKILNIQ